MKTQGLNSSELDHLFGKRSPQEQLEADTSALMFSFLSLIDREMEERGISKRALASLIGTSPAYVTQLFRGHKIINLETLAKMQSALGIAFSIALARKGKKYEELDEDFFQAAES